VAQEMGRLVVGRTGVTGSGQLGLRGVDLDNGTRGWEMGRAEGVATEVKQTAQTSFSSLTSSIRTLETSEEQILS
jgi:hypothetical protein